MELKAWTNNTMINQELTKEFQLAIKQDYGKDVTLEEASQMLRDLTQYYATLGEIYSRMQT